MALLDLAQLPILPVEQPAFFADPTLFVEAARRQHPWLARFSEGYIIHGYHAYKELAMMDDRLVPAFGGVAEFYEAQGTMWARFINEMINNRTGETHARMRASVAEAFTPRRADRARPLMRQVISELLDAWAPRKEFDFAEFASYFPVAVMCGVVGVSTRAIPRIRDAIEVHMTSLTFDRALRPAILEAWDVLWDFAEEAVSAREAPGAKGESALLDALIEAKNAGKMDATELRFMVLVLIFAGYDTSKNMLGMIMHIMLDHPEWWDRCATDKEFCARIVNEALRHSSIATYYRIVAKDFDYDGMAFKKGMMLVFAAPLTSRDPSAFEDPLRFDPDRISANHHMAFGRGEHICLGQFLAKAQIAEGLHLITQRLEMPRRAGQVKWKPFLGVWGPERLPIQFEPRKLH